MPIDFNAIEVAYNSDILCCRLKLLSTFSVEDMNHVVFLLLPMYGEML